MTSSSTPVVAMEFFAAGGRLERSPGRGDRRDGRPSPGGPASGGDGGPPAARGGPGGTVDPELAAEGRALLRALLDDLASLPGVAPVAVADRASARALAAGPGVAVEVVAEGEDPAEAAVRAADTRPGAWLWPVAPETRGRLARACGTAEDAGHRLVGPSSAGVRRAAGRRRLLRRLDRAGLPVPGTRAAPTPDAALRRARAFGGAVVIKPGRGAGGAGVTRVTEPDDVAPAWSRAAAVEPGTAPLVQPFVEGVAASAVLLCGAGRRIRPLAFSRQRLRFDPRARYEGGHTPLRHPMAGRALRLAAEAVRAAGELRGLVGVDLVLAPEGPVLMEINPRLTTSYLGLRRHVGPAAAAGALRASGHPQPGPGPRRGELPLGVDARGAGPVSFGPRHGAGRRGWR